MPYSGSTPSILGHSPDNNQQEVETNISIEIEFSTDMDPDTIDPRTVNVFYDNNTVSGSVEYSKDERRAYFNPHDPLHKDTEYTVIVRGAEDIEGNTIEKYVFSFTTVIYGSLEPPTIVQPEHQSIISDNKIVWDEVENAEGYSIEISDDINFTNLVLSQTVTNNNQFIYDDFQENTEYFVRIMARSMVTSIEQETLKIEDIIFYSDDKREIRLDKKYTPLEELTELKVYDTTGTLHNVQAEIESSLEGIITFSALDVEIDYVEVSFKYGVTKNNSRWSDTVSFYYEAQDSDIKSQILSQLDEGQEVISFIKPENTFKVSVNEIEFVVDNKVELEDVSVSLKGVAMNDIPYVDDYGEDTNGELEIIDSGDNYTEFRYHNFASLYDNNEYIFSVNIFDDIVTKEFYSELSPLYASIRNVRNSNIEAFMENVSDYKIMSYLYDNSILADEIAATSDNEINEENILAAKNFVAAKTIYQFLYGIYLKQTNAESISLGDFDVDNIDFERIEPVIDEIKEEIEYWKDMLKGNTNRGHARPVSVVKGDGEYPLDNRVTLMDEGME